MTKWSIFLQPGVQNELAEKVMKSAACTNARRYLKTQKPKTEKNGSMKEQHKDYYFKSARNVLTRKWGTSESFANCSNQGHVNKCRSAKNYITREAKASIKCLKAHLNFYGIPKVFASRLIQHLETWKVKEFCKNCGTKLVAGLPYMR